MKNRLKLTADEKEILTNYLKSSPIQLIRFKAQAILMFDDDLRQEQISRFVAKEIRTIQLWCNNFRFKRLASLFDDRIDNENASKLTRAQKLQIKAVLKNPPSDYGLAKKFWDVPSLKNYLKAEFGVSYESARSYHFILQFSELSFKYPDKTNPRRDEELIKKRMAEIQAEIAPLLKKPQEWEVLAGDETKIQLEAEIRRAWLTKGERTKIETERSEEHQNYLGFLDQKNGKCKIFEIERGNNQETIRVLEELIKQYPKDKRICLIWDNAGWHKSKELREKLKKGQSLERLHLINFPPYAPEFNPIEHVWQYAKEKISNSHKIDFNHIKNNFMSIINSRAFDYKILN